MKVYRIHLKSWTSSFRYPNIMSGFQPTLPVPPLSTLCGLISAATGKFYQYEAGEIGFVFQFQHKAVDLETIYQMKNSLKGITSNVIKREFLIDNELWLYTQKAEIAEAFSKPYFQLLLGRSGDLASVCQITEMDVEPQNELKKIRGTLLPFGKHFVAAPIQALPVSFDRSYPRRNIGTKPYYMIPYNFRDTTTIQAQGFLDHEKDWDIYWQES